MVLQEHRTKGPTWRARSGKAHPREGCLSRDLRVKMPGLEGRVGGTECCRRGNEGGGCAGPARLRDFRGFSLESRETTERL